MRKNLLGLTGAVAFVAAMAASPFAGEAAIAATT